MIRKLGGVIIWVSVGVTVAISFAGGFYTFFYARNSYDPKNPTYTYLASLSYILWALTAVLILVGFLCRNAIKVSIGIFKTTA